MGLRPRLALHASLLAAAFGLSTLARAYVPTVTQAGIPIRLKTPVHLNYVGNPTNSSDLSPDHFFQAVVAGLQRWKSASEGTIGFDYWQGSDSTLYPPNSDFNGTASIYFASNSPSSTHLTENVLGMAQVWYNPDTGEISESDIVINDLAFRFTNDPTDSSGFGAKSTVFTDTKSNVYIQNVVTHELGHAIGLSHSGGMQSTMLFMESPEQFHLGCDELTAVSALYPPQNDGIRGNLTGKITSLTGDPVFGAHIQAISQRRGTVLATSLSDASGQYLFNALEPGAYQLLAEPFYAGPSALPSFFSKLQTHICPENTHFSRTFLTREDRFQMESVSVLGGQTTTVRDLAVECEAHGGASIQENRSSRASLSAPVLQIEEGIGEERRFGIVDTLKPQNTHYYRLNQISGQLEIHALGYSLYSPLHLSLQLLTENGDTVPSETSDPVYLGDSGFANRESKVSTGPLQLGNYLVQVSGERLQPQEYPAGPVSLDSMPFLLITGTLNSTEPPLSEQLPHNNRCRMKEDFPPYQSPPGPPPRNLPPSQAQDGGIGFCGRTERKRADVKSVPVTHLLGWLFPWGLILFARPFLKLIHLRHRKLAANLEA